MSLPFKEQGGEPLWCREGEFGWGPDPSISPSGSLRRRPASGRLKLGDESSGGEIRQPRLRKNRQERTHADIPPNRRLHLIVIANHHEQTANRSVLKDQPDAQPADARSPLPVATPQLGRRTGSQCRRNFCEYLPEAVSKKAGITCQ